MKKKISSTQVDKQPVLKEPSKYSVFLLNDERSSMEFVVNVLINVFSKEPKIAQTIMMNIHNKGKGLCGLYTHEIALTKVAQVSSIAKNAGFPLKATMVEEKVE